jgi:ankyrin repeat protein
MPNSSQLTEGLLDMVSMRQPPCVKNLLDGGADVNAFRTPADSFGDGPALHLALNQRNWTMAKYLLSRGADPNIKTPYEGYTGEGGGYTALDLAYGSYAPEDVIAELKKHRAITARY